MNNNNQWIIDQFAVAKTAHQSNQQQHTAIALNSVFAIWIHAELMQSSIIRSFAWNYYLLFRYYCWRYFIIILNKMMNGRDTTSPNFIFSSRAISKKCGRIDSEFPSKRFDSQTNKNKMTSLPANQLNCNPLHKDRPILIAPHVFIYLN